jgi:hypothetical protein
MTLRMESSSEGGRTILRLIGRIGSEHLEELKRQISRNGPRVLELKEVMLVDVDVVRFLGDCEEQGIEVLHCSRYIREWIGRERGGRERAT